MRYKIFAGLGGSFDKASYRYTADFNSEDEALDAAYEAAIEEYSYYEGMGVLTTLDDIYENYRDYGFEEPPEEDQAMATYEGERYSWLDYWVEEVEDEEDDETD